MMIWPPLIQSVCCGCNNSIEEDDKLKVEPDQFWHPQCLRCHSCGVCLADNQTCFFKFNRIFCMQHYRSLFAKCCLICRGPLNREDKVLLLLDDVCHAECLSCQSCGRPLNNGAKYQIANDKIVCTAENCVHNLSGSFIEHEDCASFDSSCDISMSETSTEKHRPNCKKAPRIRTVLSEKQLNMLNKYYNINPKPDAFTKDQLVQITGLSARVIRVWFQNKRCKDKKRHIAELENKNSSNESVLSAKLLEADGPAINSHDEEDNENIVEIEKINNQKNYQILYNDFSFLNNEHWNCSRQHLYPDLRT